MAAPTLLHYARRAFLFRPFGMFVPPNLVLIGVFLLAGIREPGLLLVGMGLELAYLLAMITNARFRRLVEREVGGPDDGDRERTLAAALQRLPPEALTRFTTLRNRCEELLGQGEEMGDAETEALSSLLQVYLELLGAREGVARLVEEADRTVEPRLQQIRERVADPGIDETLRASLAGQAEVLEQRARGHAEAERKLAYVDAELGRVEDQVELLREQALLETQPAVMTRKIDTIATALGATRRWLAEERAASGLPDTVAAPAPVLRPRPRGRVAQ